MVEVKHNELKELVKKAYKTKRSAFIWGAVGIGKSATVRDTAKEIAKAQGLEFSEDGEGEGKFGFLDIRIAQLDPSDLKGLPSIVDGKAVWHVPNWFPRNPKSKGIIFFDELNLAPPSIQSSAYQLILNRKLGDYVLPEGWGIVSAGNRLEDRSNVFDMSYALKNRFIHFELGIPDADAWIDYAIDHELDSRIIAYMKFKPQDLFKLNPKVKDNAFATPRSWEFVSDLIHGETDSAKLLKLVSSAIGDGVGHEFTAFCKLNEQIDVNELLKKPELIKKLAQRVDLKYSLVSAVAEKVRNDKKLVKPALEFNKYLEAEFFILLLRFMHKYARAEVEKQTPESILDKYGKFLRPDKEVET